MKKIKVLGMLFFSIVFLSSFVGPDSFMGVKKILGEWDYVVPDASYEYQKGVLILSKVNGELEGEVRIGGQGTPLEKMVYEKNNLKAKIYVQGELVELDLNFTKKNFEGTVSYSQGSMSMNGKKR